ncbi:hypothetical protein [Carnobacterium pleistocenium]|uniref:hypothetical protein n=2 Tax=Carnobacterium pleistocenium TaxID=181073 RepID=UPI000553E79C|nr:hypothetical protein [Carnobacterium pleistocenium]
MEALHVNAELRMAAKRQNITQLNLSKKANKGHSTVSGYFNSEPSPIGAIADMAAILDDSTFTHQMANKTYGTLPIMESETYYETPHVLEMLSVKESNERQMRKNEALMILCKQDKCLTAQDKAELRTYVNEFLDEMLIEMKLVISILSKTNVSFMQAIKDRTPYWIVQKYLKG